MTEELLSEEQMLGPFFKEYADLGHWFDKAHGKCVRCGVDTIDLYEDGSYGPLRTCKAHLMDKDKLVEREREALRRARLMVSGRYRIPWTYAGDVAGSLIKKGLLTEGGYLTENGLARAAALRSHAQPK